MDILLDFITITLGKISQELKACYIISGEFCAVNKRRSWKTQLSLPFP